MFKSMEFCTHQYDPYSFIQPIAPENKHYDRWIHDLGVTGEILKKIYFEKIYILIPGCKDTLSNQKGELS